jgi:hypothetical protein
VVIAIAVISALTLLPRPPRSPAYPVGAEIR